MELTGSRRAAPAVSRAESGAGAIEHVFERHPWRWLTAFLLLLLAVLVAQDLRNRMWIDELYTLYTARQPTGSQVIKAIREGCDGAPPLYALIVHALGPVFGIAELGVRLPSTLGFCAMCAALFALLHRRFPALYAAAGMLLAANSLLYFSIEGRCYGLLLASVAGALVCWQAAAEGRSRVAVPLMTLLLAFGVALHYFTLFVLGALAAGEAVRWYRTRRPDWPVWEALIAPLIVLIPHRRLIEAGMKFTRFYWAKASLQHSIPDFYQNFAAPMLPFFVIPAIWLALGTGPAPRGEKPRMPAHEWTVFAVLSLMPIAIVVLARFTTHAFVDRYVLWSVLGFAVLSAATLFHASRGSAVVSASVVAVLLAILGVKTAESLTNPPALREAEEIHRELRAAPPDPAPVLVSNHHVYMELAYYAEPDIRRRIAYGVSPELSRRYDNIDTGDILMTALRHRAPQLHLPDLDAFLASNRRFLLAADSRDWMVARLARLGYRIVPVYDTENPYLFFADAPAR